MTNTAADCLTKLYIAMVGPASPELRDLALRLSQSTYPLFFCSTGTQALELKLQQQPCLWLIHGQLPDIAGHECAQLLAALRPFDQFVLIPPPCDHQEGHAALPGSRTWCIHHFTTETLAEQLRQIIRQMQQPLQVRSPADDERL